MPPSVGKRIFSGERGSRFHRPDLIVPGDLPEAIEVELSDKSNRRLDESLKGWRWAVAEKKVSRVRYLCSPRALPYVEPGYGADADRRAGRGRIA